MSSLANRSRLLSARPGRIYRLEMEGRTLLLTLGLLALTGVVIFALGIVTGKGMREATQPIPVVTPAPEPPAESVPENMVALNQALTAPRTGVEGLAVGEASRQTEELLQRARRELTVVEVPPRGAAPKAAAPKAPPAPAAARPEPPAARAPVHPPAAPTAQAGEKLYTVQVFSSRNQQNAQELMERLKEKGFSAYLNQFQSAGKQVWYRVRVGKTSRADAEALAERLKKEANLGRSQIISL